MDRKKYSLEEYEAVRSFMTVSRFQEKFTELFKEWKKKNPGRAGSKVRFGEKIGFISDETINNWLKGKNKVSECMIFKNLCEYLDCDLYEFAPELRFIPLNYSEGYTKKIKEGIASRGIDLNFLNFITRNFEIPHSLSTDLFTRPDANRPPASNAEADDPLVVHQGRRTYFVDDQDLDTVEELQKQVEDIVLKTFDKQYKLHESRYLKWIVSISFGDKSLTDDAGYQKDFEYRTQCIILYCPHLDPKDIIKTMEKRWKMKYTRESFTDLVEFD